jgi:Protein of unknown function (DUF664)
MEKLNTLLGRRNFLRKTALVSAGLTGLTVLPQRVWAEELNDEDDKPNVIGPMKGFSPQIGTMLSMMNWMRRPVLGTSKGLTMEQLDYLHDDKSNTIGSMLLHLAATERYYQLNTFDNMKWGSWDKSIKEEWDTAMSLGNEARQKIKGNNLEYYVNILKEVRENTIAEFKKRDDKWLMTIDETWYWGPTNNYCKWFHVCEHESNHNGQMKWIKSRIPGLKSGND